MLGALLWSLITPALHALVLPGLTPTPITAANCIIIMFFRQILQF